MADKVPPRRKKRDITSPDFLKPKAPPGFRTQDDGSLKPSPIFSGEEEVALKMPRLPTVAARVSVYRMSFPNPIGQPWSKLPGAIQAYYRGAADLAKELGGKLQVEGDRVILVDFDDIHKVRRASRMLQERLFVQPKEIHVQEVDAPTVTARVSRTEKSAFLTPGMRVKVAPGVLPRDATSDTGVVRIVNLHTVRVAMDGSNEEVIATPSQVQTLEPVVNVNAEFKREGDRFILTLKGYTDVDLTREWENAKVRRGIHGFIRDLGFSPLNLRQGIAVSLPAAQLFDGLSAVGVNIGNYLLTWPVQVVDASTFQQYLTSQHATERPDESLVESSFRRQANAFKPGSKISPSYSELRERANSGNPVPLNDVRELSENDVIISPESMDEALGWVRGVSPDGYASVLWRSPTNMGINESLRNDLLRQLKHFKLASKTLSAGRPHVGALISPVRSLSDLALFDLVEDKSGAQGIIYDINNDEGTIVVFWPDIKRKELASEDEIVRQGLRKIEDFEAAASKQATSYAANRDGDLFLIECPNCHETFFLDDQSTIEVKDIGSSEANHQYGCDNCGAVFRLYGEDGTQELYRDLGSDGRDGHQHAEYVIEKAGDHEKRVEYRKEAALSRKSWDTIREETDNLMKRPLDSLREEAVRLGLDHSGNRRDLALRIVQYKAKGKSATALRRDLKEAYGILSEYVRDNRNLSMQEVAGHLPDLAGDDPALADAMATVIKRVYQDLGSDPAGKGRTLRGNVESFPGIGDLISDPAEWEELDSDPDNTLWQEATEKAGLGASAKEIRAIFNRLKTQVHWGVEGKASRRITDKSWRRTLRKIPNPLISEKVSGKDADPDEAPPENPEEDEYKTPTEPGSVNFLGM